MKNLLTIFGTLFLTLNLSAQDLCNTYFPFEHFFFLLSRYKRNKKSRLLIIFGPLLKVLLCRL
jgi:hypothetical protein